MMMSKRFKNNDGCVIDTSKFDIRVLNVDEVVNQLNKQDTRINLLHKDVEDAFSDLNKIHDTVFDFNKRDLTDVERTFLKNFCREARIKVFCELTEEDLCNDCGECRKLIDDYYSEVF